MKFIQTLERDTTLLMQGIFSRALVEDMEGQYGFSMPYLPMFIHYGNAESICIYERSDGLTWLIDKIRGKHRQSIAFAHRIEGDLLDAMRPVYKILASGPGESPNDLLVFMKVVRRAVLPLALAFYSGLSQDLPREAKEIVVRMRRENDLFSLSDEYIRNCLIAMGIDRQYTNLVLESDVTQLPSQNILDHRMQGLVLIDGIRSIITTLKQFIEDHPEYELHNSQAEQMMDEKLRGSVAFLGRVVGRVRIVKNRAQAEYLQAEEILVSPMTTPDFLPAMKRASAFVTDEGGITCHAAIIARELKKPCIIGTKVATRVLKDGDFVEVNANEGVVKLLRKEKS